MRYVLTLLVALLVTVGGRVWAFPGQTADELILALGLPANGYVSPPVPSVDAVRAGTAQFSRVYWSQATYDPLRAGAMLRGILVTTFTYRGPGLIDRLEKQSPEVGWKDLVSHSEVFLSFVPPAAFSALLAAIDAGWTITSRTHHGAGAGYDLYSLVSKDGRLQGELSYAEKGDLPPPPDPGGHAPPTLNFWSRISSTR